MSASIERRGALALVTIDNPPVNAASHAVRSDLMAAIGETEADTQVRAVVLRAAGRTFTAGADIREFGKPAVEPHLPDVINALESVTKPWVAALHGSALGGGLEIALGCAYRIANAEAMLGLPEVTLGLIPGAGGTVRLPRLIAPEEALKMIAGGKPVPARKALELGLVDEVTDGDVDDCAIRYALQIADRPLPAPLSERDARPVVDPDAWDAAKAGFGAKARGANAAIAAIKAVQNALDMPGGAALKAERAQFLSLKADPQSAALRYIFFAERSCGRMPELKDAATRNVSTIGVVGGGTMGAGIAATCLLSGLSVTLIERDEAACTAGHARVVSILDSSLRRGLVDQTRYETQLKALTTSTHYAALSDTDLVIEAVFEDMDVKRQVFDALDQSVRADAILASNTSYLDINAIADTTRDPSRVVGLHFFSPAHVMKLLEVIVTEKASADVLATAFALARRFRKIAVPSGVCDGFIGNRIMATYRRECEYMLEDGAMPWQVDAAMRESGFPMGIFEMQDMAGLDISWAMRKRRAATRDPDERYVDLGDRLCEAGRLGQKAGKGWYDYEGRTATPSGWVEELILSGSTRKGITRASFGNGEIMSRIFSAMQGEANALLDEGIARRAEDIDVVMVNGYGFPRWRGGPMFMQDRTDKT